MIFEIQKAYIAFFNRPADPAGLEFWSEAIADGRASLSDLTDLFSQSQEYADLYAGSSPADVVSSIYSNLFGRAPEADGLAFWSQALEDGRATPGLLAFQVLSGAQGTDKTTVDNKAEASALFTQSLSDADAAEDYTGDALATARNWLGTIDETQASLSHAKEAIPALVSDVGLPDQHDEGVTHSLSLGYNGKYVPDFINKAAIADFDAASDVIDVTARQGYTFSAPDKVFYKDLGDVRGDLIDDVLSAQGDRGDGSPLMAGECMIFSATHNGVKGTYLFVDDGVPGVDGWSNAVGSAIYNTDSDLVVDITGVVGLAFGADHSWVSGSFLA